MSTHAQDADLEAALEAAGWERIVALPGMVALDLIEQVQPGPGIRLETVGDERQLSTLISLLGESFGPEEPWPGLWASLFYDLSTIDHPDTYAVVAYADEAPAAVAVGYARQPVGVVGMVGALSRFSGRGLGDLVTRHVAAAAQRLNDSPVVLQSSPLARPMYERIGFRAVTT